MDKIEKAVFDTGPLLHLSEIQQLKVVEIVHKKYISYEIGKELTKYHAPLKNVNNLTIGKLSADSKNRAKIIADRYDLDLGESTGISLAKQEKIALFLTDDLDTREVGKRLGLSVHGTLGIITRAFREGMITKNQTLQMFREIATGSTLFITQDILNFVKSEIQNYKN
jgi:predicted nucleic acid-binding protein